MCLMLCVCLLCCALPAFAESAAEDKMVMAGFDGANTRRSWADCRFFERMAELTGVSFAFQQYDAPEKWEQAKADMRPGSGLPDVLFKADLSQSQMQLLYDRGVLMDLAPMLESCWPNLYQILREHPEYREAITLPGGQIVALPYISTAPTQNAMWINRTWLTRLKLSAPTDRESLEAVLRAFRTGDPNQNNRDDEIPLAFLGPFDLKFLAHMFGIVANDYNIYADGEGRVHFAPLEDEYRAFIAWSADMYREGLMDRNAFSINDVMRQVTNKDQAQTYGIVLTAALTNLFPADWARDYEILMPLSYQGERRYRDLAGAVYPGTFAVTTACRDAEQALRWVDAMYTLEGAKLRAVGVENVDYVVDGDGTWRVLDAVSQNPSFIAETLIMDGMIAPGISSDEFELSYNEEYLTKMIRQRMELNEYCVRPFPHYTLTEAQKERIAALQNVLGYEVDMQIARWVLGEDELTDETFAQFRARLEEAGLAEFLSIWQEVLDQSTSEVRP